MPTYKVFEIYQWSPTLQDNLNNRFVYRLDDRPHYTASTSPSEVRIQSDLTPSKSPKYFTIARLTFIME